jgi:hypothetical protein
MSTSEADDVRIAFADRDSKRSIVVEHEKDIEDNRIIDEVIHLFGYDIESNLSKAIVFLMKHAVAIRSMTNGVRKVWVDRILHKVADRLVDSKDFSVETKVFLKHVSSTIDVFHALDTGKDVIEGIMKKGGCCSIFKCC